MTPAKACRCAANNLIQAYKTLTSDRDTVATDPSSGMASYAAPSGRFFNVGKGFSHCVERALEYMQPLAGTYPVDALGKKIVSVVIQVKDLDTPIEQAHGAIAGALNQLLVEVSAVGSWEVLHAVRGIQIVDEPFKVGHAEFVRMTKQRYWQWGQRYSTGMWEPPGNTPVSRNWLESHGSILGQAVAVAGVPASDADHARAEGQMQIVEALDLIRYGQVIVGWPKEPVPELGLAVLGHVHQQSFVILRDNPSAQTSMEIGPGEGALLEYCRLAPAWTELEAVICTERASRTELQRRIVLALSWAGQAALAKSSAVRLVSFMTALETLLIAETESIGKRVKLKQRVAAFPKPPSSLTTIAADHVDDLYRLRSNCLHAGAATVPERHVLLASVALAQVFNGLLTDVRFQSLSSLDEVLRELHAGATRTVPWAYSI